MIHPNPQLADDSNLRDWLKQNLSVRDFIAYEIAQKSEHPDFDFCRIVE